MKPKQNDPLESWAQGTLRQIPDRRAPAGLSRRVMAEIHRREATPWYARPWLEWNPAAKAASALLLVSSGYALSAFGFPALRAALTPVSTGIGSQGALGKAAAMGDAAMALGRAGWQAAAGIQPTYLAAAAAVFALAWISTLTLGTAAWRIARRND